MEETEFLGERQPTKGTVEILQMIQLGVRLQELFR